ncbi:hypothetical protein HaLaN_17025 [Haematococcus lacustris]|uniref:Secreted protein n=1 Tax=Haematococcus lacustris TaxID=44745 RepID=A0A699ZCX7_HAELA|nr:hypothetical protein HaLaN_17025 [Haematococcus lacustris]
MMGRAAGSGGTWLVVLAGLLLQRLDDLAHQGAPAAWLLQHLDGALALVAEAAEQQALPVTALLGDLGWGQRQGLVGLSR